jgi:hypothetical protein
MWRECRHDRDQPRDDHRVPGLRRCSHGLQDPASSQRAPLLGGCTHVAPPRGALMSVAPRRTRACLIALPGQATLTNLSRRVDGEETTVNEEQHEELEALKGGLPDPWRAGGSPQR